MAVVGVDAGTSTVKAVLFDGDWQVVATASRPMGVQRPRPGWAEQDMDDVWLAVVEVISEVVSRGTASGQVVDTLAVTAQGDGCWLVDPGGRPVRPALLWNDARATDVVDRWDRDGLLALAFERTGSWGFAGLAHAQLAWLGSHEPDTVASAATLLSCGSWIYAQLTGRRVLDVSEASNPFLRADGGGYDVELLDRLGLPWVPALLPDVVRGGSRAADLSTGVAVLLGLPPGVTVVLAPYDVATTAVGLGVVGQSRAMAVLGTTLAVGVIAPDASLTRMPTGSALDLGLEHRWLLLYATLAGTEVLDWAARLLGSADVADLVRLAGTATPSPRTPLVLPYLSPAGERTPFRDPLARGAVLGLDLEHTPADIAFGVLQGLSLTVADCLAASGRLPGELAVSGGGARSDLWCQNLADTCRLPVERGASEQVGALGAALVAMTELGELPDLAHAVAAGVRGGARFEPDPAATARTTSAVERFDAARAAHAHRA